MDSYRDDDVFGLDELVESLAQLRLHIASQTAKGESMAFGSTLGCRSVMSAFARAEGYSTIHLEGILIFFKIILGLDDDGCGDCGRAGQKWFCAWPEQMTSLVADDLRHRHLLSKKTELI